MFTMKSQTPRKQFRNERSNLSHRNSPLSNSPLQFNERDNESEEEKDSFRNRSLNSIKIFDSKQESKKL
jgi:hypothetical protein